MKKQNITLTARFEKVENLQSGPTESLELAQWHEANSIDQESRLAVKTEWFPGQDRAHATQPAIRLGGFLEGGYGRAMIESQSFDENGFPSYYFQGDLYRLDAAVGVKLAADFPIRKSLLSPYMESGVQGVFIPHFPNWNTLTADGVAVKTRSYVSTFTPEVGLDAFLPLTEGVRTVINVHGKLSSLDAAEESTQVFVGGGVGVAF